MLRNIQPAVDHFDDYRGPKTSGNLEFVHMVTEQNVRMTMESIRRNSPILSDMDSNGQIAIAGGVYDMDTGAVDFLD